MKVKVLLKFYFAADRLDGMLNGLLLKRACYPAADAESVAEYARRLIESKNALAALWGYLDGIISALPPEDRLALHAYAASRVRVDAETRKKIKRAVMKLRRRAVRIGSFDRAVGIADRYYCVLNAG